MTTIAGPHQAASRLIDEGYAFAPPPSDDRIEALRGLERAIRVFFHRQRTEQALAMAEELVRRTAEPRLEDPVRQWEPWMQTDRGLGRARRLHRLVNSLAWHGEPAAAGRSLQDAAADHLFVAVMNLVSRLPLSDEVHLFRLWYLVSCPGNNWH